MHRPVEGTWWESGPVRHLLSSGPRHILKTITGLTDTDTLHHWSSWFWSSVWQIIWHLGTRYDSRQGCFDWDLSMKLHPSGRGDGVAVRGYWGDIVSIPYLSFGVETENKDLLKKQNNQHVKTAQDISEVNVLALFECLATRGSSLLNKDEPNPSNSLSKLPLKNKYRNLFNSIFCSASMVRQLDSSLREIAVPHAALVIELAKYLLDLSKEQVLAFADRVKEIAEESGFTAAHNQSCDVYAVFTRKKD